MRNLKRHWWAVAATVLGLALAGCGDSNLFDSQSDSSGRQADLEAALQALDDGDWAAAREILQGMDQSDPDVVKYHASTYVAEAGFDSIELLRELSTASDAGNESGEVMYDALTRMFDGDGDGILTTADASGKLTAINGALGVLGSQLPGRVAPGRAAAAMSDAEIFQRGLYAAVYAVVSVVAQLEYPAGSGDLLLSIGELRRVVNGPGAGQPIAGVTVGTPFNQALGYVQAAVNALDLTVVSGSNSTDGSEIRDAMNDFLTDIGYLPDESVSDAELRGYLTRLIQ
jgi:hypothetical protein